MIARLLAFLLMLYGLGFVLFAVTLGKPATGAPTDAAIVLTGGPGRIERGLDVIRHGGARRMLIAGADPSVTKADLAKHIRGSGAILRCCVDLGSESVDTRSNAEEAQRWLAKGRYKSVRLITSDWHMRRANYEFRRVLGGKYQIVADSVSTEPRFLTLFGEYNKYVLRRIAVRFDI
ncbi:MAG: YdcF family protein [Sphingomicrobium sp.]